MSSRLKLEKVECRVDGLVTLATVQLSLAGKPHMGVATIRTTDIAWKYAVAEATIDSIRYFVDGKAAVILDSVTEITSGRYPIIVVTMTMDQGEGAEFLSGTSPIFEDRLVAVAKAVLHGLNRKITGLLPES